MPSKLMIVNDKKVVASLKTESLSGSAYLQLHVGYRAPYTIYQHENLNYNHPNGGQAKFLEQPARQLRGAMKQLVRQFMQKKKRSLEQGTLAAGNMLLEASKPLVPVDTGFLRNSGYVEVRFRQ